MIELHDTISTIMNNRIVVTDKTRATKGSLFQEGSFLTVTSAVETSLAQQHSGYTVQRYAGAFEPRVPFVA